MESNTGTGAEGFAGRVAGVAEGFIGVVETPARLDRDALASAACQSPPMTATRNLNAPHHTCSDLGPINVRTVVRYTYGPLRVIDGQSYRARTAIVPASRYV